jgi:cell division protein FtsB
MVNTFQRRDLKEYGQQNAELKKANRELTKGVKLLRQNASVRAGECRDYECLLRESEAENNYL